MFKVFFIRTVFAVFISLILSNISNAQRPIPANYTGPINYVRTWEAVAPETNTDNLTVVTSLDKARMATQYMDGLGRPIQTVTKGASPLGMDMVSAVEYDEFGREQFKYLPYASTTTDGLFKNNSFQQQANFYSSANNTSPIKNQGETYYYGQTQFEASPLNRVTKNLAPGDSWIRAGKGVEMQYQVNTLTEDVRIWNVSSMVSNVPTTIVAYPSGELYKNVTIEEGQKQVVEYKDKEGKVILKKVQLSNTPGSSHTGWLCTYYIYDDLGNLRYVLPPKAVEAIQDSWAISDDIKNELCFYYGYDARNRMTIKKVPGAAEVWMVYDKRDRLVLTQDGNLRTAGKWMLTSYDELNRPVKTGLWTESNIRTYHEAAAAACSSYNYPCVFPTAGFETLTESGYDHYDLLPTGAPDKNFDGTNKTAANFNLNINNSPEYPQDLVQSFQTKGVVTWTKVKVLGTSPEKFLYSVNIYDDKGRVIQVKSKNITDGIDVVTTQYDFSGKVLRTHVSHQKVGLNANTYLVLTTNKYDAGGRLTDVIKKVGIQNEVTILKNTYDELGQLSKKELGRVRNPDNTYTTSPIETLSYDYNIRGWMLGANRDYAKSTSSTSNYFGFDLGYDNTSITTSGGSVLGSYLVPQLNGNITGMVWKSTGDDQVRRYEFSYDNVNRLLGADFKQYNGGFNKSALIDYSVSDLTYDANGNILTQKQMGWKLTNSSLIDDMSYTYTLGSNAWTNKLLAVTEASGSIDNKLGDFTDKNTTLDDYSYDVNGNLVADKNKGITSITYNHLNLPSVITTAKGTISYTYDAGGNKLKKTVSETGKPVKSTLYLFGNYEDDVLQFLPMEEGRIRLTTKTTAPFIFDYFIKDHLGNVRMVLTEEQQTNYYPAATLEGSQTAGVKSMINWEKGFYNIDSTKITATSSIPGWSSLLNYTNNNGNPPYNSITSGSYPPDYTVTDAATSTNMYKLNALTNKTGLGFVIKVMAGDKMDIFGKSYFSSTSSYTNANSSTMGIADIFNTFLNTISNPATAKGMSEQNLETINTGSYAVPTSFIRGADNTTSTSPKAYINYILFDDQFRYVTGGFSRVENSGVVKSHWNDASLQNIPANKNGYLYVYVSNESNTDVFFDNLQVVHKRSPILEETHYYPFGLTMAGISSKAAGNVEAKKRFQGQELAHKEFSDGSGIEMYEFKWRMDDPQIGRFWQIDPLSEKYVYNSTYAFSENKVIGHVELEGLEAQSIGTPQGWLVGGFQQLFAGWGSAFSGKAEAHANYEETVATQKGNVKNTSTITVTENKAEVSTNFGEYFRTAGGTPMFEFKTSNEQFTKVENKTEISGTAGSVPVSISEKTTINNNGTKETTVSGGPKVTLDVGQAKVSVSAQGFVSQSQGQTIYGFKAAADATFVKQPIVTTVNNVKTTTTSQNTIGASITLFFNGLFK